MQGECCRSARRCFTEPKKHLTTRLNIRTLLLHPHLRSIFYGREFFGLDDVEALRMLKFPFVLAFIPHTQFGPTAPRITLDDAEAAVPFFVRYTPCFEYDTPGRYMTASHRFRFSLK